MKTFVRKRHLGPKRGWQCLPGMRTAERGQQECRRSQSLPSDTAAKHQEQKGQGPLDSSFPQCHCPKNEDLGYLLPFFLSRKGKQRYGKAEEERDVKVCRSL